MTQLKRMMCLVVTLWALCGVVAPRNAIAQVVNEQQMISCMQPCIDEAMQEQACLPDSYLLDCLNRKPECKEWSQGLRGITSDMCLTYGQRLCSCGSAVSASEQPPAAAPPKKRKLTQQDRCARLHGVWVREEGEDGKVTEYCFTLTKAYEMLRDFEKRLAELEGKPAMGLTEEDMKRLRQIMGMDLESGFPGREKWEEFRDKVLVSLSAICFLSSDEEAKVRAELNMTSEEPVTLVQKCEYINRKIEANEERSKRNEKGVARAQTTAEHANRQAGEARREAGEAKVTAEQAKSASETALALTMPTLFRLSAVGGVHLMRTPSYSDGVNETGNDILGFGGGEAQWWHPLTPKLALSLETGAGYSSEFYGSNSVTVWIGGGLGLKLGPDVLGSLNLYASHFFAQEEWSKLNMYALAPELSWIPGLSQKEPGDALLAITVRIPAGITRTRLQDVGVVEEFNAAFILGLGTAF
jgi:hypothetical protein